MRLARDPHYHVTAHVPQRRQWHTSGLIEFRTKCLWTEKNHTSIAENWNGSGREDSGFPSNPRATLWSTRAYKQFGNWKTQEGMYCARPLFAVREWKKNGEKRPCFHYRALIKLQRKCYLFLPIDSRLVQSEEIAAQREKTLHCIWRNQKNPQRCYNTKRGRSPTYKPGYSVLAEKEPVSTSDSLKPRKK